MYTVLCAVITFCIGIFIGIIVGCTPFEAYWLAFDPVWRTTHRFHCSSSPKALFVAVSIVPCPLDFLVAFIPILLVRKLTIPLGQKVALVSLFAVAFCASLGAVVRSVYLFRVIVQQGSFRTASQIYFWTNVEVRSTEKALSQARLRPGIDMSLYHLLLSASTQGLCYALQETQGCIRPQRQCRAAPCGGFKGGPGLCSCATARTITTLTRKHDTAAKFYLLWLLQPGNKRAVATHVSDREL